MFILALPALISCADKGGAPVGDDTGSPPPVDLVSPVPSGQARAGVVTDPAALFGGISAEGRPGDLVLKNDRVRFVVQGLRDSNYYIAQGGGLIDADLVRAEGEPGRDLLDEHMSMAGIARIPDSQVVTVVSDGQDGGAAIVRSEGPAVPLALILGAAESDDLLPTADMWLTTDFILEPDSWLLKLETTIAWNDDAAVVEPGDMALVSYEVGAVWRPLAGLDEDLDPGQDFVGILGDRQELAVALFPEAEGFTPSALQSVLSGVGQILVGMYGDLELAEGDTATFRRWVGVGPDLATLSGAWLEARGVATETLGGQVLDDLGAPVGGARVHLRDAAGGPVTVALTDANGQWTATVAQGSVVDVVATGRGKAVYYDVADGAAQSGPYATEELNALARSSLETGTSLPQAEGYGISAPVSAGTDLSLELGRPGWLEVSAGDGGPAKVQVSFAAGDPVSADSRLVPGRPGGHAAEAFLASGSMRIPVEPGSYSVLVHRGARFGYHQEAVEVAAGETVSVTADLVQAYSHPGVLLGDPHAHAAPSNDASVTMEARLMSEAAHGVQVHYGTDHDHVVDYRALLAPLALDGVLASVVADEVSPPLRGHFNVYPLEQAPDEANGGSVRWWEEWRELESTAGLFAVIRERMLGEPGGIIQSNHPTDSGLLASAGYSIAEGTIGDAEKWSQDFDAIEVINGGGYEENWPYYLDMVARGLNPAPVGVSDAHGPDSDVGQSVTFLSFGIDDVADFEPDLVRQAMAARATVASTGPYIQATVDGAWAPGRDLAGPVTLEVAVLAPEWIAVDTLSLLRDGEVVEQVAADGAAPEQARATFTLDPEADAFYVLVAEGAQAMAPVYGGRPWAATAAIRVDADGDGVWTSPRPALVIE